MDIETFLLILLAATNLFWTIIALWVNDTWAKKCRKLNKDWYDHCQRQLKSFNNALEEAFGIDLEKLKPKKKGKK